MFILNRNGDKTIKRLKLDLFFMGVPLVRGTNLSNFKKSYLSSYLKYWEKVFCIQLPLNSSFQIVMKIGRFKKNLTRNTYLAIPSRNAVW